MSNINGFKTPIDRFYVLKKKISKYVTYYILQVLVQGPKPWDHFRPTWRQAGRIIFDFTNFEYAI